MRVLHLITTLHMGGAERMLARLLRRSDRARFEPAVVTLADGGNVRQAIEGLGVPVHSAGMSLGRPGPVSIVRLLSIVRRLRPDVIQGWLIHGNAAASLAGAFARCPVLWNVRTALYDIANEKPATARVLRASAWISRSTAAIVYCSRVAARQYEQHGFAHERTRFIPNGFEVDQTNAGVMARAATRRALGIGDDEIVVGHVGRFHPMKDHAGFLRAAGMLSRRMPRVRFLMAGAGVEPGNPEIARPAADAGVADRVLLLGERSDVPSLLAAIDVLCSSSWSEAFPNVLAEAMLAGTPCVATDAGDSAEIVGDTGLLVPPSDPAALAEALERFLTLPAAERVRLGDGARRRIAELFSLAAVTAAYEDLWTAAVTC